MRKKAEIPFYYTAIAGIVVFGIIGVLIFDGIERSFEEKIEAEVQNYTETEYIPEYDMTAEEFFADENHKANKEMVFAPAERLDPPENGRYYRDGDTSKDYYEISDGCIEYHIDDRECMRDVYELLAENWSYGPNITLGTYDKYVDNRLYRKVHGSNEIVWQEPRKYKLEYNDHYHYHEPRNNYIRIMVGELLGDTLSYEKADTFSESASWGNEVDQEIHLHYILCEG